MPDPRTLYIVRHAKSAYPEGVTDHDRPLTARGLADAARLGVDLAARCSTPDLVLVSTALRAQQTWLVASEVLQATNVRDDERLYLASVADLLAVVNGVDDSVEALVLVGHNEGLSQLASTLSGESVLLKTAAFAVISADESWGAWRQYVGDLQDVVRARRP